MTLAVEQFLSKLTTFYIYIYRHHVWREPFQILEIYISLASYSIMLALIIYARVPVGSDFLYRVIFHMSKFQFSKISTKLLEIKSREYSKRVQRIKMLPIHVFISIFFNADVKNHILKNSSFFENFIIFLKILHRVRGECGAPTLFTRW